MKNGSVMTEEMCEQTASLRESGCSYAHIAKTLGVSQGTISYYCLKQGIESPNTATKVLPQTAPGPRVVKRGKHYVRHFTAEEDQQIEQMAAEGVKTATIAKAIGRRWNSTRGRMMTLARQQERRVTCTL